MKIFKYPLPRNPNEYGICAVTMPADAKIISSAVVGGEVVIYAATSEPTGKKIQKEILIVGTGKEILDDTMETWKFLGTVVQGVFVWHIFH